VILGVATRHAPRLCGAAPAARRARRPHPRPRARRVVVYLPVRGRSSHCGRRALKPPATAERSLLKQASGGPSTSIALQGAVLRTSRGSFTARRSAACEKPPPRKLRQKQHEARRPL